MCWDFKESCILQLRNVGLRERVIDVLIFTANVLYGSWILVGIGLTEKCQLHLRKVAPKYVRLNVGYTCIVANEY